MGTSVSSDDLLSEISTPAGRGGVLATIIGGQSVPQALARAGLWLSRIAGKPLKIGNIILAIRHADVEEALRRDLHFRIAPINAARIETVNGPFVLGMDRGTVLEKERRILYQALSAVDLDKILSESTQFADSLLQEAGAEIDAVGGYARIVAGRTARALFGIAPDSEALFLEVARAVFAHTFLNLGNDSKIEARAVRASEVMGKWFREEISRRRTFGDFGDDMMGQLIRRTDDDELVRRTLGGMFVGSIDTTATTVAKVLTVIGERPEVRTEAERRDGETDGDWYARLVGWYREALRKWPHNPVVLREATSETTLGGADVPKGARLFLWTQAAMQDATAFPDPERMEPDRPASAYFHFGGGLHPCAGRAVNDRQIPMLIGKLLDRGYKLNGRMRWAGPFPDHLPVNFEEEAAR